jgi:hypothetical protein
MQAVPPLFTISFTIIPAIFGSLGLINLYRSGAFHRFRLRHSVPFIGSDDRKIGRELRRNGIATIIYVVPPGLSGSMMLSFPHQIHNPGRLAIKDVSIVLEYPARFGVSDAAIRSTAKKEATDEYVKVRSCQVRPEGTQVLLKIPILRSGETQTVEDPVVTPMDSGLLFLRQTATSIVERLKVIPGFRDFFTINITIFSEKTSARRSSIDVIVVDAPSMKTGFQSTANIIDGVHEVRQANESIYDNEILGNAFAKALEGSQQLRTGHYVKRANSPKVFKTYLGVVLAPDFFEMEGSTPAFGADSDTGSAGSFLYRATTLDWKRIPSKLGGDELARYLGLRPVRLDGLAKYLSSLRSRIPSRLRK